MFVKRKEIQNYSGCFLNGEDVIGYYFGFGVYSCFF